MRDDSGKAKGTARANAAAEKALWAAKKAMKWDFWGAQQLA
jgi:hypothetical protein